LWECPKKSWALIPFSQPGDKSTSMDYTDENAQINYKVNKSPTQINITTFFRTCKE